MDNRPAVTNLTAAESLSQQEWENICNRCGLCCFEKFRDQRGLVITTPVPCRYLDLHSRECKVYGKRFQVGENCQQLTPEIVATVDWLPEECAYRQRLVTVTTVKKSTEKFWKKRAIKQKKSAYHHDDHAEA